MIEGNPLVSDTSINTHLGYASTYDNGAAQKAWMSDRIPNHSAEFLNRVRESGGKFVFDLASGPANVAMVMARLPESDGLKFICVDSVPKAVEEGREAIQKAGLNERVQLIEGNILHLPEIPELQQYSGRGDIFERYGGTSHFDLKDRRLYYHWLRRFIRDQGFMFGTIFNGYDKNFYGYHPLEHPVAELTPDRNDPTYPDLAKYHGIYHKFWKFPELQDWYESQGFDILKMEMSKHPRVPEERYVWEVITQSVRRVVVNLPPRSNNGTVNAG